MSNDLAPSLYPRARLDALTDGIYAVAMTLLVLDVRLPDDFNPRNAAELSQGLLNMWPKVFPYLLSFLVLGMRWLSIVDVRSRAEYLGGNYIRLWLLNLLLITCVPFSTMVVGRHASLAPAVWLYAGNMALLAIASWWQLRLLPEVESDRQLQRRQILSMVLLASAFLCIAWSFVSPAHALWGLLLNLMGRPIVRWRLRSSPN